MTDTVLLSVDSSRLSRLNSGLKLTAAVLKQLQFLKVLRGTFEHLFIDFCISVCFTLHSFSVLLKVPHAASEVLQLVGADLTALINYHIFLCKCMLCKIDVSVRVYKIQLA